MIPKPVLDAMQILSKASQVEPYRLYIDTLNNEIVRADTQYIASVEIIAGKEKRIKDLLSEIDGINRK